MNNRKINDDSFSQGILALYSNSGWKDFEWLLNFLMEKCKTEIMEPTGYGWTVNQVFSDIRKIRDQEIRGKFFIYKFILNFMSFIWRYNIRKKRNEAFIRGMYEGIILLKQNIKNIVTKALNANISKQKKFNIPFSRKNYPQGREQLTR